MDKFYITTPIYYVNDKPHVGHAYTTMVADVLARYARLRGNEVVFSTGTDENSQKTVDAAGKSGEDARVYADRLAGVWKDAWQKLEISYSDFIRTTEERHRKTVEEVWRRISEKGDIYKGTYEGLYCRGHEAFVKESELADGKCPDHQTAPERIKENNYFFRLSKYQNPLLEFYEKNPGFVFPDGRFEEMKKFVSLGLEDISVSREGRSWGIPVPGDPEQAIYVWFDALINYISTVGIEGWQAHPADVHTVGKDIVRFHAVIWPAMLMSAGLELPKRILANGFFTVEGAKISKSLGNAVDPLPLAEKYGVEALRYFLLREVSYGEDGDFSEAKLAERHTADLANGLGNLVSRVAALGERAGDIEAKDVDRHDAMPLPFHYDAHMAAGKFSDLLAEIWHEIHAMDKYINDQKLWEQEPKILRHGIAACGFGILYFAKELEPFMPKTAVRIREMFRVADGKLAVKKGEALFPRLR